VLSTAAATENNTYYVHLQRINISNSNARKTLRNKLVAALSARTHIVHGNFPTNSSIGLPVSVFQYRFSSIGLPVTACNLLLLCREAVLQLSTRKYEFSYWPIQACTELRTTGKQAHLVAKVTSTRDKLDSCTFQGFLSSDSCG